MNLRGTPHKWRLRARAVACSLSLVGAVACQSKNQVEPSAKSAPAACRGCDAELLSAAKPLEPCPLRISTDRLQSQLSEGECAGRTAFEQLAELSPEPQRSATLLFLLQSRSDQVRWTASRTLGARPPTLSREQSVSLHDAANAEKNPPIAYMMGRALAQLPLAEYGLLPQIVQRVRQDPPELPAGVLAGWPESREVPPTLLSAVSTQVARGGVRHLMRPATALLARSATTRREVLELALNRTRRDEERALAVRALGSSMQPHNDCAALLPLVLAKSDELGGEAAKQLATAGGGVCRPQWTSLLAHVEDEMHEGPLRSEGYAEALGAILADLVALPEQKSKALRLAKELVADPLQSDWVRHAALLAVGKSAEGASYAVRFERDRALPVRMAASLVRRGVE